MDVQSCGIYIMPNTNIVALVGMSCIIHIVSPVFSMYSLAITSFLCTLLYYLGFLSFPCASPMFPLLLQCIHVVPCFFLFSSISLYFRLFPLYYFLSLSVPVNYCFRCFLQALFENNHILHYTQWTNHLVSRDRRENATIFWFIPCFRNLS